MAYLIVLVAALFHAIWNSMVKDSDDRLLTLAAIRFVGMIFGLTVVCLYPPLEMAAVPYLIAATLLHYAYYWLLLHMYEVGDFSQVYPIARGAAPLIVLVLGPVFAGEYLSPLQVVATVLISLGIISICFSAGRPGLAPAGYALATAAAIAGYSMVSGLGVRIAGHFLVYAGWLELMTGLGVVGFALARRKKQALAYARRRWKQGVLAGLLGVSAFVAVLWAFRISPIAPITALRETSIIFAALIGVVVFKEGHALYRIPAACVAVAGIALLVSSP